MPTLTEGRHPGGFLVWEAFRDYCREVVTVAAGTLEPGTVLGKITVGGKYVAHDPDATDGSQAAAAVLWDKADAAVWLPSVASGSWATYLPPTVILPSTVPGSSTPVSMVTTSRQ